jgi:very-short-patch-repair endonuclease
VDFYCAEAKLVIEIDGDVHAHPEQARQDEKRSKHLEELGYKIIRFTNDEVLNNLEGVAQTLLENI